MSTSERPVFLAREAYRKRRLMDAARVLPVIGAAAFLFPVLWAKGAGTGGGLVYLFVVWALLIVAAWVLGRRLPRHGSEDREAQPD